MKTPPDDITITRWIDGDLEGEALVQMEAWAATHPELLAERDHVASLGNMLRENIPASEQPPYADFFNTRIMRAVEESQPAETPAPSPASSPSRLWQWLAAPMALAAMAVCFFVGTQMNQPAAQGSRGLVADTSAVYTPDSTVTADVFHSQDDEATIIVLEGLEDIPDSIEMAGAPWDNTHGGARGNVMVNSQQTD